MNVFIKYLFSIILSINGYWVYSQSNLNQEQLKEDFSENLYTYKYWENIRFDTIHWEVTSNKKKIQTLFIKYLLSFKGQSDSIIKYNFSSFFNIPSQTNESIVFFYDMFEKYLFNPNSPVRSEILFEFVLKDVAESSKLTEIDKSRVHYLLKMINKNRVGQTATDFPYSNLTGALCKLYQLKSTFILLQFSNEDCLACQEIYKKMKTSEIIQKMLFENKIKILTIELGNKTENSRNFPVIKNWIFGKEIDDTIENNNLYFIQALPTFYLLDGNKKILIKDGYLVDIECYLRMN